MLVCVGTHIWAAGLLNGLAMALSYDIRKSILVCELLVQNKLQCFYFFAIFSASLDK